MSANKDQIILITGVNPGGLAWATAKALNGTLSPGSTILLTARIVTKAEAVVKTLKEDVDGPVQLPNLVSAHLDIESDESIDAIVKLISEKYGRLDVLVNNAGSSHDFAVADGKMTLREAFNQTFSSNVTSTHLLTHAMIPLLLKSSDPRTLFVGSKTGSLAVQKDTEAMPINKVLDTGWPKGPNFSVTSYRTSKTAMRMMALEWCRVLKYDNVRIFILEPGWLATSLGKVNPATMKAMGAKDPSEGGEYLRDIINGLHDKEVETFMSADGEIPW